MTGMGVHDGRNRCSASAESGFTLKRNECSRWTGIRKLGQLARIRIPVRSALPLSDDQLFNEIDGVAIKYLDLGAVRTALDAALTQVEPPSARDEIEVAVDHLCAVLNVAYLNAGVAFGVTLADLKAL